MSLWNRDKPEAGVTGEPMTLAETSAVDGLQPLPSLIARSAAMQELLAHAERFAATELPVLITGEAGTGKRLLARTLHALSGRSAGPFVSMPCAATPAAPVEAELFRSTVSTATGATRRRGLVERSVGGTLFLDEPDSLPESVQGLLMHMLEIGDVIRPAGEPGPESDPRLISGVTCASAAAIAAPRLRRDLYYRLGVLRLHMPPLRDRQDDIVPLARLLLREATHKLDRVIGDFTPAALAALKAHRWPGNARELTGVVQRAVVMAAGDWIEASDLHFEESSDPVCSIVRVAARPEPGSPQELKLLLQALKRSGFNLTRTARELNVSRVTLYRMLRRNYIELRQDWVVSPAAGDVMAPHRRTAARLMR